MLSRELWGWQVICWALGLSFPAMALISLATLPSQWAAISLAAWLALGYVSLFSMLVGFFFWYRGLALGGIASVTQLQLLQPFIGLLLAAWLLHEPLAASMLVTATAVAVCVAGARRFGRAAGALRAV